MKKKNSLFMFLAVFVGALTLSSCTKSFCTVRDKAAYLATLDVVEEGKDTFTMTLNEDAEDAGYLLPSDEFVAAWNVKIETYAQALCEQDADLDWSNEDDKTYALAIAKFAGNYTIGESETDYSKDTLWQNYDAWMEELVYEVGVEKSPDQNYIDYYKTTYNKKVSSRTQCISPVDTMINGAKVEGKTWKQAFNYGLLEGLFVYPVSWLIYQFSVLFGLNGWGQLLSILVVTIIVRGFIILCTFKPTASQQKMTSLSPELAKIQAKYPNAQSNMYERQKMQQEQMALYKKNGVNPASMFIVMLVQFPVFICVWSAMIGSSVLMDGYLFEGTSFALSLGKNTGAALGSLNWVAIVLFVLMAAAQFIAMKIPQIMQKKKEKNVAKLQKNPTEEKNAKTMTLVSYGMTLMIVLMGLQLPIAMTFYWLVTALISLAQSLITQKVISRSKNKKDGPKEVKYKTKKTK